MRCLPRVRWSCVLFSRKPAGLRAAGIAAQQPSASPARTPAALRLIDSGFMTQCSSVAVLIVAMCLASEIASAAEVKLLFPQGRTSFQTNEWIDVSVVRSSPQPLAESKIVLTLSGLDGSRMSATFPARAVSLTGGDARATEHLHLNGRLIRPGKYTVDVTADGASANAEIEICSHVRNTDFRLVNWSHVTGANRLLQGAGSFGFNLVYGVNNADPDGSFIRGGVDYMANCTMSGGHQMDLRNECDWSDPFVTRGGTMRVVRRAMIDRGSPNVAGVHFYDEPGLTWDKHPVTGEFGPHGVAAQMRAYHAAFGKNPISYHEVDPKNPDHVARWQHFARWKLGFMDAAWRESQFGVSFVRPDFLSLTQSQYGWTAFTDGYYFTVARSLPITSGHGGYHDFGPGFFNPSYFLEMSRARDHHKPCWYLPCWYGNTTADEFRLEQYLSFQTGLHGMISPPDVEPSTNPSARQGIVESNIVMAKLGPVFVNSPPTKAPVALLYSLSQCLHTQTLDRTKNYAHEIPHGQNLPLAYLAIKLNQQPVTAIVDEDILDGTLAADHRAVVLTSINHVDPAVVRGLESFAAGGGLVLLTADSSIAIKGAVKLPVAPAMPDRAKIDEIMAAKKYDQLGPFTTVGKFVAGATPLAKAIRGELDKKQIKPVFECDIPTIIATRHVVGDVEYTFAVNATPDESAKDEKGNPRKNAMAVATATISFPDDGRSVYDAVRGGDVTWLQKRDGKLTGSTRFGPGQMRVFARPAVDIASVSVSTPVVVRQFAVADNPLHVDLAATVIREHHEVMASSVPLSVRVIDPLGQVRHEFQTATKQAQWARSLPLAANDPAGDWSVVVRETLANVPRSEAVTTFKFAPPTQANGWAGSTLRAVSAMNDRENIFRFARLHHEVTVVAGSSPFHAAAVQRLAKNLEPWGIRCKTMDIAEASKPRTLSDDEARTWVGLSYAGKGQIKPGAGNPLVLAGFAVPGPVILLGNPTDNAIIKFLLDEKFLAYKPDAATFPGPGRGYLAWQRDGVGRGQESIALIAYDEAGINEAVGSLYEAVAGIEPLTKWNPPEAVSISPAQRSLSPQPAAVAWTAALPADRVLSLRVDGQQIVAVTHDGSVTTLDAAGKVVSQRAATPEELQQARNPPALPVDATLAKTHGRPDRLFKLASPSNDRIAVAYWGGTLRIAQPDGKVLTEQQLPQDVTVLTWHGDDLLVGLADGRVMALPAK